jgi:hypothetical protein
VPGPPSKPPPKPGSPAARLGAAKPAPPPEDAIARSKREKDELEKEAQAVEEELEALKARYDQYFLGIERREPVRWREELKKKVLRLKTAFTRNTGLKFKIQSLHARFLSYERLWLRSAREREEGTYRRDLFKARLRAHHGEEKEAPAEEKPAPAAAEQKTPAPAKTPSLPKAAAPRTPAPVSARTPAPAAVAAAGGMSEPQMRALYDAYLAAKVTCREDVSKLTYDAVARSVSKQIPELISRYKAKSVEFKVEVKGGKAVLKAIPKV